MTQLVCKNGEMNINLDFFVEFYAYNISALDIVHKVYMRVKRRSENKIKHQIVLKDEQLYLLSRALTNEVFAELQQDRYYLYDLSFRESVGDTTIGFSFHDIKDSNYIEPHLIFAPFSAFGIDEVVNSIYRVERAIFYSKPRYNPIFMIGTVFKGEALSCLKAYIRYDQSSVHGATDRINLIRNIIKEHEPGGAVKALFYDTAVELESLGFVFSFVGLDYYGEGKKRYKVYFRFYKNERYKFLIEQLPLKLSNLGLFDKVEEVLLKHNSIWGIALATDSFEHVNGVQLYFYP